MKIKKVIRDFCKKNKALNNAIYIPYANYCEKKQNRAINKQNYKLDDKKLQRDIIKRKEGINFWFLLEQGHDNIGDMAIGIAEKNFFEKYFAKYPKHFIYEPVFEKYKWEICEQISKEDVIILRGGGSIGNTIMHEQHREEIMRQFKGNLIISMPQTMCFPDTDKGLKAKKRASKIYAGHRNMLLIAREEKTYTDMKALFPYNDIILTPDIVMTLDYHLPRTVRDGILLCFRNDWEKSISNEQIDKIQKQCGKLSKNVKLTDMRSKEGFVSIENRMEVFLNKIEQFKHASLVITDRLHGMVFSAISGTPCIALSNYNHKVRETYKWLKQLPYIKFCETTDEAINEIPRLYNYAVTDYDNSFTQPYFDKLVDYINGKLNLADSKDTLC